MSTHGGYIIMKRIPPDAKEVPLYVTYFWDRLKPSPVLPGQPSAEVINLDKHPRYFARRELLGIKHGEDLVAWANKWIDADDWRRARDTVRAWRYKSRNQLVRASLREETKELLDKRAKALDLSLWRYMQCLELTEEVLKKLEQAAGIGLDDML